MQSPASGPLLADVNLWLATLVESHPDHRRAAEWWRDAAVPEGFRVCFCRMTQLGLLRLLTNETVMGPSRRSPDEAWDDYEQVLAQDPVEYLDEPGGIDRVLRAETRGRQAAAGLWTDAYLAAFAQAGGLGLVTFDRGFRRFTDLDLVLL